MLFRLTRITLGGSAEQNQRYEWVERAIAACRGQASPLHAQALNFRAYGAARLAADRRDESLASRVTDWAEAGVAMSQQFPAPWQMDCRPLAGQTYTMLNLSLPSIPNRAEAHFVAAVAAAPPRSPYLGLRARVCCYLALHKAVGGDVHGALELAREAQADGALEIWGREDPLALALAVTLASTAPPALPTTEWVVDTEDALNELHAYDEAAGRADWGLRLETVALYGGFLAVLSQDWEKASRLLAAGEPSIYRAPYTTLLYFTFRDRVRAALGSQRSRQVRDEGRAMSLTDAREAALADSTNPAH